MQDLNRFEAIKQNLDNRTPRERLLILVTAVVILYIIMDIMIISPLYNKLNALQSQIKTQEETLAVFNSAEQAQQINYEGLAKQLALDISQIKQAISTHSQDIHYNLRAQEMLFVLDALINAQENVTLISMSNDESLNLQDNNQIFVHPIHMVVEGQFIDLLGLMAKLEVLPIPMIFEAVNYEVHAHPNARVTIQMKVLTQNKMLVAF